MIKFATGNLLNDDAEALVNTVNTVGVMGKGMALMFKEAFPNNYKQYAAACKLEQVKIGKMFVTELSELLGPKWIINFPTKKHWRYPTKIAWIEEGLQDLIQIINEKNIRSVAIPPLGSGNGGLEWSAVREKIELALCQLDNVEVIIYEPTSKYQNIAKQSGVEKLTPARAMIAELVRRYWILGIECSLLEIHKLAWFLERVVEIKCAENPLKLNFQADKFGPYANRLDHLLNALDGSYLRCDKRIADANPLDIISFHDSKRDFLHT